MMEAPSSEMVATEVTQLLIGTLNLRNVRCTPTSQMAMVFELPPATCDNVNNAAAVTAAADDDDDGNVKRQRQQQQQQRRRRQ